MAKTPPGFMLYVSDYLGDDTLWEWTLAERGAYLEALMRCWRRGGLDPTPRKLSLLWHISEEEAAEVWRVIQVKFVPHPSVEGWVVNERLERERASARSRSSAGRRNAAKRWSDAGADAKPMPTACQTDAKADADRMPKACSPSPSPSPSPSRKPQPRRGGRAGVSPLCNGKPEDPPTQYPGGRIVAGPKFAPPEEVAAFRRSVGIDDGASSGASA